MKTKRPNKSVAQMAVLKDIRGLLSATLEQESTAGTGPVALPDVKVDKVGFEEQLRQYEEMVRKQQAALDKLEVEKKELDAKLRLLQSAVDKPAPLKADATIPSREISDLEARKADLSAALSQIEELLQFKTRELTRRIARVYQEAGDIEAGRDFRRITDQLEAAENFGEFIRALLRG